MTNDVTYREKGRAVILAALMVLSVVAMAAVLPGAAVADHGDDAADLDSGNTYWAGQDLALNSSNTSLNATWNVYGVDGQDTSFETQINIRNGHAVLDTSRLDTDEYDEFAIQNTDSEWVIFDDNGVQTNNTSTVSDASFNLLQQNLGVEFEADTVSDLSTEVGIDVTDDRGTQNLIVEADGLNGEDLEAIFADADANNTDTDDEDTALITGVQNDQTLIGNFTGVDTGNYTFTFTSADTGVSASDSVEVVDGGNVDASFADSSVSETLGDIASVTIELDNTETAEVTLGSESDGWMANATVTDKDDDGKVTVFLNTAYAGNNQSSIPNSDVLYVADDDDDSASVINHSTVETENNVLATGSYDMKLETQGMQTARGTLNLQEGSIDSATTAKLNGNAEFADADELAELLDDNSAIAQGDKAVIAVEASGIFGYEDDWDTQGIDLTIEQSEPAKNRQPVEIDSGNYTKYTDSDDNVVYYVIDTDGILGNENVENGEEFNFSLGVTAEDNDYLSEDAEVSSTYTVSERSVSFAQEEYTVGNTDSQEISGTSNLASGSEVDVTAQTGGDNAFFNQKSAEVDANGDWTATFDFSDHTAGVQFDLTVEDPESDASDEATGVVEDTGQTEEGLELSVDAPSEITTEENGTVTATVTNHDAEEVTETVEFEINNETYTQDLTIGADSSAEASFDVSGSDLGAGDYEWSVDAGEADSDSGTLSVSEPGSSDDSGSSDSGSDDSGSDDSSSDDSGSDDDGDDDGTPGFGVGVALVALLAAAMLALRRQD